MKKSISMIFLISILIYGCGPLTPYPTSEAALVPGGADVPSMLPDVLVAHPELVVILPENIAQLKQVDQWGIGQVNDIALSPDGTIIAVATTSGVHLFDRKTLKELNISFVDAFLTAYPYPPSFGIIPPVAISAVDFSSTNEILAVSTQNSLYFWNIKDDLIESELGSAMGGASIGNILYSPDDKTILVQSGGYSYYCGGRNGYFSLYSLDNGSLIYNQIYCADPSLYHSFGFLSDSSLFVVFDEFDSEVQEWHQQVVVVDPLTGMLEKKSLARNEGFVTGLTSNGNLISRAYEDKKITSRFLDFNSQALISSVEGELGYQGVSGNRLLTFSEKSEWQDESGAVLCDFDLVPRYFSNDESTAISWYDWKQTLIIWDIKKCGVENNLFLPSGDLNPTFSSDNKFLAIGGRSYLHLLDTTNGEYVYSLPVGSMSGFSFVPGEDKLLSGTGGGSYVVRLVTYTGDILKEFNGGGNFLQKISVSSDGKKAAILDARGFGLWNMPLNDDPYYQTQHLSSFNLSEVQFSPDSAEVALGLHMQNGNKVLFLNSDTGEILREFTGLDYWQLDFSPDWKSFALADNNGYITIHDIFEGKELVKLNGFNKINQENSFLNVLEYNPVGNIIASSENGFVRFWVLPSGQFLGELETGMDHIYGLAFSNDGRLMIVTSAGGLVHVWGVPKDE